VGYSRVDKITQLRALILPVVEDSGYMLWGLDFNTASKRPCLRVFIEHENGVSLDDCAMISRQISAVLDVEDPISTRYNLEVSSPGMARQLFTPVQYQNYCGDTIDVVLLVDIDGRKKFKGILNEVHEDQIVIDVDGNKIRLPFSHIAKAKLVPEF